MPFPALDDGESVVFDLRPHWRRVVVPAGLLPVVVGAATYLWFVAPSGGAREPLRIATVVVALLVLLRWSLRPWLRWLTTRYVVTTARIVTRTGVMSRRGRDVPLRRVNDVAYERTLVEQLFRSGTLIVDSAGERGEFVLVDVPRVAAVQRAIYRLVDAESRADR